MNAGRPTRNKPKMYLGGGDLVFIRLSARNNDVMAPAFLSFYRNLHEHSFGRSVTLWRSGNGIFSEETQTRMYMEWELVWTNDRRPVWRCCRVGKILHHAKLRCLAARTQNHLAQARLILNPPPFVNNRAFQAWRRESQMLFIASWEVVRRDAKSVNRSMVRSLSWSLILEAATEGEKNLVLPARVLETRVT